MGHIGHRVKQPQQQEIGGIRDKLLITKSNIILNIHNIIYTACYQCNNEDFMYIHVHVYNIIYVPLSIFLYTCIMHIILHIHKKLEQIATSTHVHVQA